MNFKHLKSVDNIKDIILNSFDIELDISGGWGYSKDDALIVNSYHNSLEEFTFMFASIRANIELNMMQDEQNRYGGINLNLIKSDKIQPNLYKYTYQVSAIKNELYKKFIKEYKEGYGTKEFDLNKHFQDRKKHTISKTRDYWFKIKH